MYLVRLQCVLWLADVGATVERISYGERIVLRPGPLPPERPYEKGWLCFVNM